MGQNKRCKLEIAGRSQSGAVIPPDTLVKVIRLEGVKLYVDVPQGGSI